MSIPPVHSGGSISEKRWEPEAILRAGWHRRSWVLLGLVLGLAVGAGLGLFLPRVYQSSAQISVVKKRPDAVTGWDTRQISTDHQISPPQDVLKSSFIIENAIHAKGLASLPSFAADEHDLTETIRNALTVAPTRGPAGQSYVFKLHYRGASADDCNTVLTAILESYKDYMDKKHQSVSEDTIELILRDKQQLEKELAQKEAAYREFRETAPLLGKGKDGLELQQERLNSIQTRRSALLLQRVEVEGQLSALQAALQERRSTEAILTMIAEFARKSDTAEAGRDKTPGVQEQLLPLLLEERKLLELYGSNHPEVLAVRQRISAARRLVLLPVAAWKGTPEDGSDKSLEDAIGLHVQLLGQRVSYLKVSERLLGQVLQSEQDEARRLASYEIQNDALRTNMTMHQQLYEALVKRLNEVSLTRNVGGYQIEMIEPPSLGKRVAPSRALTLLLGAGIGTCGGLGFAYGARVRDARLRPRQSNTGS